MTKLPTRVVIAAVGGSAVILLLLHGASRPAGAQSSAPPPNIWAPTTVPFSPVCTSTTSCQEIGRWTLDHFGTEVIVVAQPLVDDAIAQWGDCLASVFSCLDGGDTVPVCVESSGCPAYCKSTFRARLAGSTDEEAAKQVFEELFLADGGECLPREAADATPPEVTP